MNKLRRCDPMYNDKMNIICQRKREIPEFKRKQRTFKHYVAWRRDATVQT